MSNRIVCCLSAAHEYATLSACAAHLARGWGVVEDYTHSCPKLQTSDSRITTNTDYIGGIQYSGTPTESIAFIQTEEGKAVPNGTTNYDYYYYLGDNLGNTRLTFDTKTGTAVTLQQDDYYPFGLEINRSVLSPKNEYLYNKKELQEEFTEYDYGARHYDPVIGRWNAIDILADENHDISPYVYAANNPANFADEMGLDTVKVNSPTPIKPGDVADLGGGNYSSTMIIGDVTITASGTGDDDDQGSTNSGGTGSSSGSSSGSSNGPNTPNPGPAPGPPKPKPLPRPDPGGSGSNNSNGKNPSLSGKLETDKVLANLKAIADKQDQHYEYGGTGKGNYSDYLGRKSKGIDCSNYISTGFGDHGRTWQTSDKPPANWGVQLVNIGSTKSEIKRNLKNGDLLVWYSRSIKHAGVYFNGGIYNSHGKEGTKGPELTYDLDSYYLNPNQKEIPVPKVYRNQ